MAQKVAEEGSGSVEMLEQLIELTQENKEELFSNPESVSKFEIQIINLDEKKNFKILKILFYII